MWGVKRKEAAVGVEPNRDFASVLDDLIASAEAASASPTRSTIPFDYLAVADELHSGRITVSSEAAAAEYQDMAADGVFEALFPDESSPEDLSTEPDAISQELGLADIRIAADFAKARRTFAFKNHPDRVAPHLRDRAIQRMQIANMLIDEARKRALKGLKR